MNASFDFLLILKYFFSEILFQYIPLAIFVFRFITFCNLFSSWFFDFSYFSSFCLKYDFTPSFSIIPVDSQVSKIEEKKVFKMDGNKTELLDFLLLQFFSLNSVGGVTTVMDCMRTCVHDLKFAYKLESSFQHLIAVWVESFKPVLSDCEFVEDGLKCMKLSEPIIEWSDMPGIGRLKEKRFPIDDSSFLSAFEVILFLDMVRVLSNNIIIFDLMNLPTVSGDCTMGIINIVIDSHRLEFYPTYCLHSDLSNMLLPKVNIINHNILQYVVDSLPLFSKISFFEKSMLIMIINAIHCSFFNK